MRQGKSSSVDRTMELFYEFGEFLSGPQLPTPGEGIEQKTAHALLVLA